MFLYDSVTATAAREGLSHLLAPYALGYLDDAFHGYIDIFRSWDEVRRWFY